MRQTGIEFAESSWNPIRGCKAVSAGCENCWAERIAGRWAEKGQTYYGIAKMVKDKPKWTGKVQWVGDKFWEPIDWLSRPRRILVGSMTDLFYPKIIDEWRDTVFGLIAQCGSHRFLVQTRYAAEMRDYFKNPDVWKRIEAASREIYEERYHGPNPSKGHLKGPLSNTWLGVSVEDQQTADERIPILQEIPAPLRWVQAAPLIGQLSLAKYLKGKKAIDWVIADGESGAEGEARPCDPGWMRRLRDECREAGKAFFFHQWGTWLPVTTDQLQEHGNKNTKSFMWIWPSGEMSVNLHKSDIKTMKQYGAMLDGEEWKQIPLSSVAVNQER